jgi:hypothetical protein
MLLRTCARGRSAFGATAKPEAHFGCALAGRHEARGAWGRTAPRQLVRSVPNAPGRGASAPPPPPPPPLPPAAARTPRPAAAACGAALAMRPSIARASSSSSTPPVPSWSCAQADIQSQSRHPRACPQAPGRAPLADSGCGQARRAAQARHCARHVTRRTIVQSHMGAHATHVFRSGAWATDASVACIINPIGEMEGHHAHRHSPHLYTCTCSPICKTNHSYPAPRNPFHTGLHLQQRRAAVPC